MEQTHAAKNQTEAIISQTKELIYQRRLSILPKLSVGFTRLNDFISRQVIDCLELRNIGNGSAVNIAIDDIKLRYGEDSFARLRFDNFLFLEPNKDNSSTQKFAHLRIFIDNEDIAPEDPVKFVTWSIPSDFSNNPVAFFRAYTEEKNITLVVRFQDVDGASYYQSVTMEVEGDKLGTLKLGRPTVQLRDDGLQASL